MSIHRLERRDLVLSIRGRGVLGRRWRDDCFTCAPLRGNEKKTAASEYRGENENPVEVEVK